jgi:hypothetical protein
LNSFSRFSGFKAFTAIKTLPLGHQCLERYLV